MVVVAVVVRWRRWRQFRDVQTVGKSRQTGDRALVLALGVSRVRSADSRLQSGADVMGQRDHVGDPRLEAWDCWIDARMCRACTLNSVWSGGGSLHLCKGGGGAPF